MSLVAHDGKVVFSGGKALTYDSLIALANATTGENDKTLADAVDRLIDGYGQGGLPLKKYSTSEFVPSSDANPFVYEHGLDSIPNLIVIWSDEIYAARAGIDYSQVGNIYLSYGGDPLTAGLSLRIKVDHTVGVASGSGMVVNSSTISVGNSIANVKVKAGYKYKCFYGWWNDDIL